MTGWTETVTVARLRPVTLPTGERVALVTLDNGAHPRTPNTFGPEGLASLDRALDAAEKLDVDAIAVTGKPYGFAAGADLGGMATLRSREQARELLRLGHRVFGRLGDSAVPTFALLGGVAMGGGLELALHCGYRAAATTAAPLGLPEVGLGLVPAWGGSYLLPHLVGPAAALTVMVENPLRQRTLSAPEALGLGLVDALFEPADFLERALEWVGAVLRGETKVPRSEVDTGEPWAAVVRHAEAAVDARLHGAAPAPYRAVELVGLARTADRAEAFAAEDEVGADLLVSPELRAGLYAFDLVSHRTRPPAGAPDATLARPIGAVGVVGAGLMASQLALLFARRLEVPVVLTDVDEPRLDHGLAWIRGEVEAMIRAGRLGRVAADRLLAGVTGSLDYSAYADADLVLEAVVEDLAVKRQVLAEVESVVAPTTVLATNTSSLSIDAMAEALARPERLVGLHFFNPVARMRLLEVVRGRATDDSTVATGLAVGQRLGKTCVLVRDAPAFVVNRLLVRFLGEVFRAVDEGTPVEVADAAVAPLGLPMPPFVLLGLVGPAVALHTTETLHAVFPDRFPVSENLRRLVAAGKSGVYLDVDGRRRLDPEVAGLLRLGDARVEPAEVRRRALAALADEARRLLDEEVVASPADLDLAMLLGAGWPFHLGGVTPYLDRTGISEAVTGGRFASA